MSESEATTLPVMQEARFHDSEKSFHHLIVSGRVYLFRALLERSGYHWRRKAHGRAASSASCVDMHETLAALLIADTAAFAHNQKMKRL